MNDAQYPSAFPKQLSVRDREWIEWILPGDRAGYKQYRDVLQAMVVLGDGRRGKGEMILGYEGNEIDVTAPLAPVFAYGAIETNFGTISITLREIMDDQISVAAAFGDIDNDGKPDLFVTTVRHGNRLFKNLGGGAFKEITKEAGVDYSGHSWSSFL